MPSQPSASSLAKGSSTANHTKEVSLVTKQAITLNIPLIHIVVMP